MVIGQRSGDKIEAAYRRGDLFEKKRGLLASGDIVPHDQAGCALQVIALRFRPIDDSVRQSLPHQQPARVGTPFNPTPRVRKRRRTLTLRNLGSKFQRL
jgi:hypothetical protein